MSPADKTLRIRIKAANEKALSELPLDKMDRGCTGGIVRQPDGSFVLEAMVQESVMKTIAEKRQIEAEVLADVEEEGKRKQEQVGKGNRFKGDERIPRGLGKKVRDGGKP